MILVIGFGGAVVEHIRLTASTEQQREQNSGQGASTDQKEGNSDQSGNGQSSQGDNQASGARQQSGDSNNDTAFVVRVAA